MAINEAISAHKGCRDSFVRSLVKETLRTSVTLDMIIDSLASGGIGSIRQRPLIILRMGLCAIRSMDSVPDHAAVNEAVELARRTARGTDRFINAVLRSYIRSRDKIEYEGTKRDGIAGLMFRYSSPQWLAEMITKQYPDESDRILSGLLSHPPLVLRINRTKCTADEALQLLAEDGIEAYKSDMSELALIVSSGRVTSSRAYREGLVTIQSLSSILAVEALSPAPGSRVLDMCAAPGGKTCMMAELMNGVGSITACDIHEHRLELIGSTARRLGTDIIDTRILDGTAHDARLEGSFDYVLADVPCSGLGVIGSKPDLRLRTDPASFGRLIEVQEAILTNAGSYVRPGGLIEYSTCTLNRDENEGVVLKALEHLSFLSIVEMHTYLPYNDTVGFYYCILQNNA